MATKHKNGKEALKDLDLLHESQEHISEIRQELLEHNQLLTIHAPTVEENPPMKMEQEEETQALQAEQPEEPTVKAEAYTTPVIVKSEISRNEPNIAEIFQANLQQLAQLQMQASLSFMEGWLDMWGISNKRAC